MKFLLYNEYYDNYITFIMLVRKVLQNNTNNVNDIISELYDLLSSDNSLINLHQINEYDQNIINDILIKCLKYNPSKRISLKELSSMLNLNEKFSFITLKKLSKDFDNYLCDKDYKYEYINIIKDLKLLGCNFFELHI